MFQFTWAVEETKRVTLENKIQIPTLIGIWIFLFYEKYGLFRVESVGQFVGPVK